MMWRRKRMLPSVEVLRLKPGDVLLVRANWRLMPSDAENIKASIRRELDWDAILVVSADYRMSVIRPSADLEAVQE